MAVLATNEALRAPRMDENAHDAAYYGWQSELSDLARLPASVKSEPRAPEGDGYRDLISFKLCGSAEYHRTGLTEGMAAFGKEIERTLGWVAGLPAGHGRGWLTATVRPATSLSFRSGPRARLLKRGALPCQFLCQCHSRRPILAPTGRVGTVGGHPDNRGFDGHGEVAHQPQ